MDVTARFISKNEIIEPIWVNYKIDFKSVKVDDNGFIGYDALEIEREIKNLTVNDIKVSKIYFSVDTMLIDVIVPSYYIKVIQRNDKINSLN